MHRQLFALGAVLSGAAALVITACGSSSSNSPSAGSSSSASTPTPSALSNSGGSFCNQAAGYASQFSHLGSGLFTPGATPSVSSFKQLIAEVDQAVDTLDGSAPGEIAPDFHALRSAYDQANSRAQSATTFQQLEGVFSGLDSAALKASSTRVTDYFKNTCGISTTPTP
jgi:hypothetical protein